MVPAPGDNCDLDALVDEVIRKGEPNARFGDDSCPLGMGVIVVACIQRRLDLVRALLAAGATMSADDLAEVIGWMGDAGTVAYFLESGVPPNGDCLRTAVYHGTWQIVVLLMEHGLDIHTPIQASAGWREDGSLKSPIDTTLLHAAVWAGEAFMVRRLLQRGFAVDCRDEEGWTPLMKGSDFTSKGTDKKATGLDTIYWLLESGADPNAANVLGDTPLLLCTGKAERCRWQDYVPYRTEVAKMLLRFGADSNITSPEGFTPLMFAARDNDAALARALLQAGAKFDLRTSDGREALDVAKQRKSRDVEKVLCGL